MSLPHALRLLVVLTSAALALACSDDERPAAAGAPRPLPECPELDFAPCDVREVACQERLASIAACVFGSDEAPSVAVRVLGEDELREELLAEVERPSADQLASDAALESMLIDLDLAARGDFTSTRTVDELLERFDGLYRDAERGITLVDRGAAQDSVAAAALLVHEFVHALQDERYDLAALGERAGDESDAALALRAIVEGQATWYQYRVVAAMLGYESTAVDFERIFAEMRADLVAEAASDESRYLATFGTFPYAFGTNLAYEAWLVGQQGFEAALFAEPPSTTREVIWRSMGWEEPIIELPTFEQPAPSDGFTLLVSDSLGAFLHELCWYAKELSAVDWLGDRIWLYGSEGGRSAWLWQLEVDGDAAATARELQLSLPSYVSVEGSGRRLFAVAHPADAPFLLDAGRAFLGE